jgi:hypothetical protein
VVSWNSSAPCPNYYTPRGAQACARRLRCSTGGTESAGSAGRSTPPVRRAPSAGYRTRPDSPRGAPGYRTRPIPVSASPSDKAGAESQNQGHGGPAGCAQRPDGGNGAKPPKWNRAPKQRFRFALLVRCTALLIVAVASARKGRSTLLTRRLPTAVAVRKLERAPAGRFNSQPTYVYAYAKHSVADCPQGQLCDPTPPRSCGARRGVAQGDVHAAPALPASTNRAR